MELIQQIQSHNQDSEQVLVALFTLGALQIVHHNGRSGSTHPVELARSTVWQVHGLT
jgi:hypothetical protein